MSAKLSMTIAALSVSLSMGCAQSGWPDEPGIPVELRRFENIDAGDTFLAALTSRRGAAGLAEPSVAPRYQAEIEKLAEDLQAGKVSVVGAERAVGDWARSAYQRDVKTYTIDCSTPAPMSLPSALIKAPFVTIAYAAAHFRPRSLPSNQCVILAVVVAGTEDVRTSKP